MSTIYTPIVALHSVHVENNHIYATPVFLLQA